MSWAVFSLILAAGVITVVLAAIYEEKKPHTDVSEMMYFFGGAAIVVSLLCLFGMGIREWSFAYGRAECKEWGVIAERDVRYELSGYWDGNCLVRTEQGWVGRDSILKVEE